MGHTLGCFCGIASADQHYLAREIAGVWRIFRKTGVAGRMQFDRPAVTGQPTTLIGDRRPWERPEPLVVREQMDTQRIARRVGRGNTAEGCPQDFTTFAYIAPEQEVEQIFSVNGISRIAEQHFWGRAVERGTRKIGSLR